MDEETEYKALPLKTSQNEIIDQGKSLESVIMNKDEVDQYVATQEFSGEAYKKFMELVPTYLISLRSNNLLDINNVLNDLYHFLMFTDNSPAAELMMQTEVFEALLLCNLIENKKMYYMILRRVVSCSKDVVLYALRCHILHKILESNDLFDSDYSANVCCIIYRIMESSQIATALVYSTGLFDSFNENLPTDPNIIRNISLLFDQLFKNSPIKPYKIKARSKAENRYLNESELDRFFDNFEDDLFNKEKIKEYHTYGINANDYINILIQIFNFGLGKSIIIEYSILCALNRILSEGGIRPTAIVDDVMIDNLTSLSNSSNDEKIISYIVNFFGNYFYQVAGTIDDITADTILTFLLSLFKEPPPEYLFNLCCAIFNLILSVRDPKSLKKKFGPEIIAFLHEIMNGSNYNLRKEVTRLFVLIGSRINYKIFDEESMEIIVSFMEPENKEFEFSSFVMKMIGDVITHQGKERFDREGNKSIREMFVEANGDETVLQLLNEQEMYNLANYFYDNFIDREFDSPDIGNDVEIYANVGGEEELYEEEDDEYY
ncbi:hypothetical protein TVAG_444090 [Trichomonas vaginalis G3]|uniref:Uncharacterized protein n=1 Tax=Trichomonas vaginalis (strain ATCC PRA-98 / G3) TaxID=412133 RepID=A2E2F1_TRIV3|nr:armadillo (ARM) repeat-containing protein family [Trichomonas vaginalis G3]EAY13126.1 hypothetical protein TVAG_444090 [Trichomonas vaginalis G3]KAI5528228.1 armadillo (ARM) repeat-containing protein family [Trichomonas vaginalis G3]|eukprot:XP_001325349.1 hypothetical protein [Trichomonas vaginalis G3]